MKDFLDPKPRSFKVEDLPYIWTLGISSQQHQNLINTSLLASFQSSLPQKKEAEVAIEKS